MLINLFYLFVYYFLRNDPPPPPPPQTNNDFAKIETNSPQAPPRAVDVPKRDPTSPQLRKEPNSSSPRQNDPARLDIPQQQTPSSNNESSKWKKVAVPNSTNDSSSSFTSNSAPVISENPPEPPPQPVNTIVNVNSPAPPPPPPPPADSSTNNRSGASLADQISTVKLKKLDVESLKEGALPALDERQQEGLIGSLAAAMQNRRQAIAGQQVDEGSDSEDEWSD